MNIKIKIRDISLFTVLVLSAIILITGCNGSEQKNATAGVICEPDNGGITLPDAFAQPW
jgi:hypothetical protein